MNIPQYQFNLGNPDPILSERRYNSPDYLKTINDEIVRLNEIKQTMSQPVQNVQSTNSIWNEIDSEISSLTNEQKNILGNDETYVSIDRELQFMIQQELINLVKNKIENSQRGKELLEAQLKNIRNKKKQIVEESNKQMELFKQFQIAVQANPNITYPEFIKNINKI